MEVIKYILFSKEGRILILPIMKYEKDIINYVLQWGWIVKSSFYCPNPYYKPILMDYKLYCINNTVYGCTKISENEDPFNTESPEKINCTNILLPNTKILDIIKQSGKLKKIDIYIDDDNFLTDNKTNQKHFVLNVFKEDLINFETDNLKSIINYGPKPVKESNSVKTDSSINNIKFINIILIILIIYLLFRRGS